MTAIAHRKRKREVLDDVSPAGARYDFVKRRRNRPIETGFAALSLAPTSVGPAPSPTSVERTTLPSFDLHKSQNSFPSTEACDLPSREIQMKSSSWYEPEKDRIVILDLDSSSESGDETPLKDSEAELTVSPALLAKLKKLPSIIERPKESAEESGRALVLFRPPVWKAFSPTPSRAASLPADEMPEHAPTDCIPMELDP